MMLIPCLRLMEREARFDAFKMHVLGEHGTEPVQVVEKH